MYTYLKQNLFHSLLKIFQLLNYLDNEVYAGRIPHPDSAGVLIQKPVFIQGRDQINPDSIRFNFDTKKALIWNSKTQQSDMNIFSKLLNACSINALL